jgi:hypothetical protein
MVYPVEMRDDDHHYHRDREQQCRALAKAASDPDVRRRHEELAELHAIRAAQVNSSVSSPASVGAA